MSSSYHDQSKRSIIFWNCFAHLHIYSSTVSSFHTWSLYLWTKWKHSTERAWAEPTGRAAEEAVWLTLMVKSPLVNTLTHTRTHFVGSCYWIWVSANNSRGDRMVVVFISWIRASGKKQWIISCTSCAENATWWCTVPILPSK